MPTFERISDLQKDYNLTINGEFFVALDVNDLTQGPTGSVKVVPLSTINNFIWETSGYSANWNSVYTTVNSTSSMWGSGGSSSGSASGGDPRVNTLVYTNSANWISSYNTVNSNSAIWVTVSTSASNAAARKALTGLRAGDFCYQVDNSLTYQVIDNALLSFDTGWSVETPSSPTLQFRQGTRADMLVLSSFAIGEPVWATDAKNLYVGDAITSGGVFVGGRDTIRWSDIALSGTLGIRVNTRAAVISAGMWYSDNNALYFFGLSARMKILATADP